MIQTIPEEKLAEILSNIPSTQDEVKPLFYRDFVFNLSDLRSGGSLGIALVCLRDAFYRLGNAKIALHNAYIQNIWYKNHAPDSPREVESIFFSKFYLDYVPLLLYAIQEDVAEFIISFLNEMTDFQAWKKLPGTLVLFDKKRVESNAGRAGLYLKEKHQNQTITKIIIKLISNKYWKKSIKYRNTWVHQKPPIIEGLGIQHNRESRIIKENGKKSFGFGGSTVPEYSIEELFEIIRKSIEAAALLMNDLITIIDDKAEEIKIEMRFW
jgi:hypothetical protein